jgi:hypothetical protein
VPFSASSATFPNPERGFYRAAELARETSYDWVTNDGFTLVMSYVRLDDYRERDLDATLLDDVSAGFGRLRKAGLKVILRFAYNFGPGAPNPAPDAAKRWVLRHIEQVKPLLRENADVIAVLQAGFIGAWGEWHSSSNGLANPADKTEILTALLAALPATRAVQVRTPRDLQNAYGEEALDEVTGFTGSNQARTGHHNDCFLASEDDWGTYPGGEDAAEWKAWVATNTLYVPMGGETCNVNPPRSECGTALAELEQLHFTYLNDGYEPAVVESWTAGGCREEMDRRLGYRIALKTLSVPEAVRPGGVLPLTLQLSNSGWAPPINPRPVRFVLDGPERHEAELLAAEVRRWFPGTTSLIAARLQLPAALPEGDYVVSLRLPDSAAALASDPRFSIRLANDGVWSAAEGINKLATVRVSRKAPGSSDPTAQRFEAR